MRLYPNRAMDMLDFVAVLLWNLIVMVMGCFAEWNYYGPVGPSYWAELWPVCCAGNQQSPIDLNPSRARHLNASTLSLHGFSPDDIPSPAAMDLVNNGHTIEIKLIGNFYIRGGPLDATYQTVNVNFHWGGTDNQGSEHSILGRKYSGEIQILHYDRDALNSLTDAIDYRNGVAVLAVFIEIGTTPNPTFDKLVKVIDKVKYEGDTYIFPRVLPLEGLLPGKQDRDDYYFYEGSLTTPECNEVVQWLVFRKPIYVTKQQLASFRQIQGSTFGLKSPNRTLVDNFRPTQPLNNRTVFWATCQSNACGISASIWYSFVIFVFHWLLVS